MSDILNIVLPTFLVILIGYIFGRTRKLDISPVVDVAFYLGLPAVAFVSILDKKIVLLDATKVWASAIIIMLGCGIIAWLVFKILKQKHSGLYLPIVVMNTVNIPFPVIYLAYGSEGLLAATLFYIPVVLVMFSFGIYVASGKHWRVSLKQMLSVPTLYAAIIGLLLNFANVAVPKLIIEPLSLISQMAIPLVLLILGYNLSKIRLTALPTTVLASVLRLGVGLLLGLLVVKLFNLTGILMAVVILDSAMPAAANVALLATKYENESELVSSVVLVTTIACLVIIPFLLYMLR
ncbi:MAG: hypothetical protein HW402_59 [Dehalococcoidales bacterium]|nr:hypothetical protein [Dehalococcoidales bacterium]